MYARHLSKNVKQAADSTNLEFRKKGWDWIYVCSHHYVDGMQSLVTG